MRACALPSSVDEAFSRAATPVSSQNLLSVVKVSDVAVLTTAGCVRCFARLRRQRILALIDHGAELACPLMRRSYAPLRPPLGCQPVLPTGETVIQREGAVDEGLHFGCQSADLRVEDLLAVALQQLRIAQEFFVQL